MAGVRQPTKAGAHSRTPFSRPAVHKAIAELIKKPRRGRAGIKYKIQVGGVLTIHHPPVRRLNTRAISIKGN